MDSLVSAACTNLTSTSTIRIRKGLRQIDSLFAQICLTATSVGSQAVTPLLDVKQDPAFLEFCQLQDRHDCNGKLISIMLWPHDKSC